MGALRRFLNQWRGAALQAEFDEELRFHLESRAQANQRAGLSPAEAELEARRHIGSVSSVTERMREARVSDFFNGLARDARHALRLAGRQPWTTALAVLTLSLGIGANAAMFSLLNAALFRPLPFPAASQLVAVVDRFSPDDSGTVGPTIPEALDLAQRTRSFTGVSFFDLRDAQTFGGLEPVRVLTARVEPSLFSVLGVGAAVGRVLESGDSVEGASPVVVLSDGLWRSSFGADPSVLGRPLLVNGQSFTVVGVMPAEFSIDYLSPEPVELYVPYPLIPLYTQRSAPFAGVRRVTAVGRLRADVGMERASAELGAIASALVAEHPSLYRSDSGAPIPFTIEAQPLRDLVSAPARRAMLLLWAAVALVLLIACVNTAQLLLTQAIEREPEMALRGALGARQGQLVRQWIAESLVLSAAACLAGILQAVWLVRALQWLLPDRIALVGPIAIDRPVLLFTCSAAVATVLACGILPGWHLSRSMHLLPVVGRTVVAGRRTSRHLLVAVEVAVSVVLLVGAGLVVGSLLELQRARGGYDSANVTLMRLRGMSADGPGGRLATTYRRYLEQVSALPDVRAAALTSAALPGPAGIEFTIIDGAGERGNASYQMVSGTYFSVLGIPMLEGRTFTDFDVFGRAPVAIVNAELARRFWPGRSALQQQLRAGPGPRAATMTVVGVVGNVRPPRQLGDVPQIYVPILQQDEPSAALLVRPRPGTTVAVASIKQAIWSVMPQQAVFSVEPLNDVLSRAMADERAVAALLAVFAMLALVMSTAGVYTLVTYITTRHTREIAVRRALGATAFDVLSLLAGQTFRWTLVGLVAGVAAAAAMNGLLASAVPGLSRFHVSTGAVIAAAYLIAVAAAMGAPALRAMRLAPATALRAE